MCVCVRESVCERERERERESNKAYTPQVDMISLKETFDTLVEWEVVAKRVRERMREAERERMREGDIE